MAETKPTEVPRWADTGTRVEPSESKKDDGWVNLEKPPFSFFNWLLGFTGDWFKWIDERFFDGVSEDDLRVKAPGDPATDDTDGGDLTLEAGSGRGTGSSKVSLKASSAGTAGSTQNVSEDYIVLDGSAENIDIAKFIDTRIKLERPGTAGQTVEVRTDASSSRILFKSSEADKKVAGYVCTHDETGSPDATILRHQFTVGAISSPTAVLSITETEIRPNTTLSTRNGTNSLRWIETWSGKGLFTDSLIVPTSQDDLVARHAQNCVVVSCSVSTLTPTSPVLLTDHWNVASVAFVSGGRYTLTLDEPISTSCSVVVNASDAAFTTPFITSADVTSTTTIDLQIWDDTGTVDDPLQFTVTAFGRPSTLP